MKITRKGYDRLLRADGTLVSQHTSPEEAYERASISPPGTYRLEYAPREIEVPQAISQPQPPSQQDPPKPPNPPVNYAAVLDFRDGLGWRVSGSPPEVGDFYGRRCMRCVLDWDRSPTKFRCEITADAGHPIRSGKIGVSTWEGFALYLPDHMVRPSGTWEVLKQWHGVDEVDAQGKPAEGRLNPPISLGIKNGRLYLSILGDSRQQIIPPGETMSGKRYESQQTFDLGPIDDYVGGWNSVVMHIRWGFRAEHNPITELWINDSLQVSYKGANCFHDRDPITQALLGPWPKMGLYNGWMDFAQRPSVFYREACYADYKLITDGSGGYEDVRPNA
jgi:hypothetical protein